MTPEIFNSRRPCHRFPLGAVPAGTGVHFKISPMRSMSCSGAWLIVEKDGGGRETLDMFWCGMNGADAEWWECDFFPQEPGLYFYRFELRTDRGHRGLFRASTGGGSEFSGDRLWQLTVYDKAFTTPDWLAGGVMYQIFPDRFACSGEAKTGVPQDRVFHEDRHDIPVWRPDEHGEVRNNDYFGGDLRGIEQKLPYLKQLGVTCLYLNPIFEAHSNHRYNTADYSRIDPLLGTEEDFTRLCRAAKEHGIRILLDGVFSHTGSDSIYFNREKRYGEGGAYNDTNSPYYPWYTFRRWPDDYDCWWNFTTLPNIREMNPEYNEYINGTGGIAQRWLHAGASGWRLDVADELPDGFLDNLRQSVKAADPDAVILGEVWEDASTKMAYGQRRRYLLGGQLDSVMNYPFREAILGFLTGKKAAPMMEIIESVVENYPPQVVRLLMNHIGTHDTERAITVLCGITGEGHDREWQEQQHLTPEQYRHGRQLLCLASLMQFTLPGVPCIYYGDEAGMQGCRDPFNRGFYPWKEEDRGLISWYQHLAEFRRSIPVFREGGLRVLYAKGDLVVYTRLNQAGEDAVLVAVNRGDDIARAQVDADFSQARFFSGVPVSQEIKLPAFGYSVMLLRDPKEA